MLLWCCCGVVGGLWFFITNSESSDINSILQKIDPVSGKAALSLYGDGDTGGLARAGVSGEGVGKIEEYLFEMQKNLLIGSVNCSSKCLFLSVENLSWNLSEEEAMAYGGMDNMFILDIECRLSCAEELNNFEIGYLENLEGGAEGYSPWASEELIPIIYGERECNEFYSKEEISSCYSQLIASVTSQ